jgi:hypothetical protein
MATITHLQTNYQQPEKEIDENGIETVYTTPSYKTADGKVFGTKDDAKEHQNIVDFVQKHYWDWAPLSGYTNRGNGIERVLVEQNSARKLLINMLTDFKKNN